MPRLHLALGLAALSLAASGATVSTGSALDAAPASKPPMTGVAVPDVAAPPKRGLPTGVRGFRFLGEADAGEWPLFVEAADAGRPAKLRLSYVSAVSVMPEASRLSLSLNDEPLAELPIEAASTGRTVEVDIPPGLLRPGHNALRIAARQRHRVDCSTDATYELWTQIDPARTGLLFGEGAGGPEAPPAAPAVTAAVLDGTGTARFRVVLPASAEARRLDRAFRVVQEVAVRAGFPHAVVEVSPERGRGRGLDVAVGTTAELAAMGLGLPDESATARVVADGDRLALRVVAIDGEALDRAIRDLPRSGVLPPPAGTPAGLRALEGLRGHRVEPGGRLAFGALGVPSQEFSGRLFRLGLDLLLPADALFADYGKAELRLSGGYAPGLSADTVAVVHVNGRVAGSLPLARPDGDVFRHRSIPLPLSFFRPGANRLELTVNLPSPADATCEPLSALNAASRLLLLDDTDLSFPAVARVARLPDLAATAGGGLPFAGGAEPARVFVPHPDADTLGAAATLTTRLAVSAGRPLDASLALTAPPADAGSALVVGALDDVGPDLLAAVGVPADVRGTWRAPEAGRARPPRPREGEGRPTGSRATLGPETTGSVGPPAAEPAPRPDLYEAWRKDLGRDLPSRVWRAVREKVEAVAAWPKALFAPLPAPQPAPVPPAGVIVAQERAPVRPGAAWTLALAPTAAALKDGVEALTAPGPWSRLDGRAAAWDARTRSVVVGAPAADPFFVGTQPFSVGNGRLVAAGWFSLHPGAFVALLTLAAACLGAATTRLVGRVGERNG